MSRKTLLLALVVAAIATACGGTDTRAGTGPTLIEPVEIAAAEAQSRPSLIEPVEIAAAKAQSRPSLIEPVEIAAARAPAGPPPVEALRAWDAQRAEAWALGDPRLLAPLYTADSVAGRRDRSMLRAWAGRGLAVRDLRTQLLAVRVLAHTRSTWTLRVTDRLVGAVAVGPGVRRPLPHDAPTTRTVELLRVSGSWLVSAVEPLDSGP